MFAVVLALISGCGPQQQVAPPPPEVSAVQPVVKEVTEWDDFTGRLEPIKSVEVRARVSGWLDSIHFKDGQVVKTGDLLFVIDPRPSEAERTRADLQRAEAQPRRRSPRASSSKCVGTTCASRMPTPV